MVRDGIYGVKCIEVNYGGLYGVKLIWRVM